jgi:hypothetical protein
MGSRHGVSIPPGGELEFNFAPWRHKRRAEQALSNQGHLQSALAPP